MKLRLDHLLEEFRSHSGKILAAIDADPLLTRRQSGPLVLANAGAALFTPQEQHQLFAKGIVYRREPLELVSLPLIKIYNLGERDVSATDLAGLSEEQDARLYFLRKFDGTMIQRFQFDGRVYFTTRGMIEGGPAVSVQDEDAPQRTRSFDFLGTSRQLAKSRYPTLCEARPDFEGLTLIFEFLHPETRVITNYGEREDLVLLACFDRRQWRYRTYVEVKEFSAAHALTAVDELTPAGRTLGEQIDAIITSIAGTDQEGTVIAIEHGHRVVYRAKVKSPDYLRVLKLMVTCTYAKTVEMLDAHPEWSGWPDLEAHLRGLGREQVPEEVLSFYKEHYDTHIGYLADCERLRAWAVGLAEKVAAEARAEVVTAVGAVMGAAVGTEVEAKMGTPHPRLLRKAFAAKAVKYPLSALLFAAFDGRLDPAGIREFARTPSEARESIAKIGETKDNANRTAYCSGD